MDTMKRNYRNGLLAMSMMMTLPVTCIYANSSEEYLYAITQNGNVVSGNVTFNSTDSFTLTISNVGLTQEATSISVPVSFSEYSIYDANNQLAGDLTVSRSDNSLILFRNTEGEAFYSIVIPFTLSNSTTLYGTTLTLNESQTTQSSGNESSTSSNESTTTPATTENVDKATSKKKLQGGILSTVPSVLSYPNFNTTAGWTSLNPYYSANMGQCTWFAWGRFYEIYGYSPGFTGNGYQCVSQLLSKHSDKFTLSSTPKIGAIFSSDAENNHVGIVTNIQGNAITIQEGNLDGESNDWATAIKDWREVTVTLSTLQNWYGAITFANPIEDVDKTKVEVSVLWNDEHNAEKVRPSSCKVQLYADGKATETAISIDTSDDKWSYTFNSLSKYSSNGLINYTLKEVGVDESDYKQTFDSKNNTFTNLRLYDNTDSRKAVFSVEWSDGCELYDNAIILRVLKNGIDTGQTVTLDKENDWFTSLDLTDIVDENGERIEYDFINESVPFGYELTINKKSYNDVNIDSITISVHKTFENRIDANCTPNGQMNTLDNSVNVTSSLKQNNGLG